MFRVFITPNDLNFKPIIISLLVTSSSEEHLPVRGSARNYSCNLQSLVTSLQSLLHNTGVGVGTSEPSTPLDTSNLSVSSSSITHSLMSSPSSLPSQECSAKISKFPPQSVVARSFYCAVAVSLINILLIIEV